MRRDTWVIDGRTVQLHWGGAGAPWMLSVDDDVIFTRETGEYKIDRGFVHRFWVGGYIPCAVRVVNTGWNYRTELLTHEDAEALREADRLPLEISVAYVLTLVFLYGALFGLPIAIAIRVFVAFRLDMQ